MKPSITMHLFFDTVWKLHTGEIPEKPDPKNYLYPGPLVSDLKQYENTIAAIKQNAITVGNPILCPQNMSAVEPGKFYEWIGGYDIVGMGTVAILTLPEEKKNTMENQYCEHCGNEIIEARFTAPTVKHRFCSTQCTEDYYEARSTASGSVTTPTWYTENEMYDGLTRNNYHENIAKELSSKWAADLQGAFNKGFEKGTRELKEREEALKELLPLIEEPERLIQECIMDYSEVKFCPIRQGKGNQCRHCFDKAIIDRARKTLNQ